MPDPTTTTPASPSFEKLKLKLRELFELDKADLDFGTYRILRQRHTEITEFLDKHLEKTVREALTSHGRLQQAGIEEDLRKAEAAAQAAGITPEQSPRVMELRVKYGKGSDLDATADEVYSHLLTFFSRYYQEGDFLGLQRSTVHGREKYMIPYNGEEVKLVWANMDQYYIKSSELLRDYTFHIRGADLVVGGLLLDDVPDEVVIHFKLVEGDTEKDNRKPDGKTTRAFALDAETPFEAIDADTLRIRFRYREHPSERNLQDKLNADTEKTLADSLPPHWKSLLFATDLSYKGKDKKDQRTMFQKHLRSYTAKFLFDYFIHKDLGSFLQRELDFYVKNEVMHLDDIEDIAAPKADEYLSKIRAIRRCALPVIRMLTQLEEFQKKLWLKKKFVVETRYCLTLDRVPEALYTEICANEDQWKDWDNLYSITELKPKRTPDFLKANAFMMLDTRHFGRDFILKLLASIENLDSFLDGVCFHSENFQALQLMQERYREQVKCVYIDPPYNTGQDGFAYKDSLKSSTWTTMISDRIYLAGHLLNDLGVFFSSINEIQRDELVWQLDYAFGPQNRIEELIWVRDTVSNNAPTYSTNHEYIEVAAKDRTRVEASREMFRESRPGFSGVMEIAARCGSDFRPSNEIEAEINSLYTNHRREYVSKARERGETPESIKTSDPWKGIYPYKHVEYRDPEGKYVDDDAARERSATPWVWREVEPSMPSGKQSESTKDCDSSNYRFYQPLNPTTGKPCKHPKRGWSFPQHPFEGRASFDSYVADHRIEFSESDTQIPQQKYFLHEVETVVATSIIRQYADGEPRLEAEFGRKGLLENPKPPALIAKLVRQTTSQGDAILDFFAGSGTTGEAVIELNRDGETKRKYLLAEMGEHFDTVLVPRLKKVSYSTDWKDGKPQTRNTGISQAFKIVRLEGYEDTLNNLNLRRAPEQEAALAKASAPTRDQYLLSYFLDVESAGSKSLLDLAAFRDPFAYKLNIATSSAGETKETTVDLVETFNWLLGLKVKHIDAVKGFLTVTGEKRAGGRTLILWRTLSSDPVSDNVAFDKFLTKLAVNPADTEYDFIYVNGSHTLNDPCNKVHLIEETFQRLMFDTTNFESLS